MFGTRVGRVRRVEFIYINSKNNEFEEKIIRVGFFFFSGTKGSGNFF